MRHHRQIESGVIRRQGDPPNCLSCARVYQHDLVPRRALGNLEYGDLYRAVAVLVFHPARARAIYAPAEVLKEVAGQQIARAPGRERLHEVVDVAVHAGVPVRHRGAFLERLGGVHLRVAAGRMGAAAQTHRVRQGVAAQPVQVAGPGL